MPTLQQLEAALNEFTDTLTRSKVLRLGIAYLETEERFRPLLARELGIKELYLYQYSKRVKNWPLTCEPESTGEHIWSNLEDNLLMDFYQVSTFEQVCEMLSNRTPDAIRKRASFLGVTR